MEELILDEKAFAQGYNDALLLCEFEPAVAEVFRQEGIDVFDDYSDGFNHALKYDHERQLLDEFHQLRNKDLDLDRGRNL